jgi:hypothetical protein
MALIVLVPDQVPQECTGGPRSRLGSLPSSRRMALAAATNLTINGRTCEHASSKQGIEGTCYVSYVVVLYNLICVVELF